MIINNNEISLNVQKFSFKCSNIKESLRVIKNNKRDALSNDQKDITLNIQGKEEDSDLKLSPEDTVKILIVQALLKRLTGRDLIIPKMKIKANVEVKFYHTNLSVDNPASMFGIIYNREETYYESEEMVFNAKGVIETQDGKK